MDKAQIPNWIAGLSALSTLVIACVTFYQMKLLKSQVQQTAEQVRLLRLQTEQSSAQTLTNASNEQNWKLFEHWQKLPYFLPSWSNLTTEKQWAWRVLHLNHLNLLQLAYQAHSRGLLNQDEMNSWGKKARFWYSNLWEPNPDPDNVEGRNILRQMLRPEEGFPKEFRDWLVRENIIPPNFVLD